MKKLVAGIFFLLLLSSLASSMERQSNSEYRARRLKLAQKIAAAPPGTGVFLLLAGAENEAGNAIYGFRQDDNFYYLTGWTEPGGAILIAPEVVARPENPNVQAHPYTEIFFLPDHNLVQEKWTGPKLGSESPEATKVTGFDRVAPLRDLGVELAKVLGRGTTVYSDLPSFGEPSTSSAAAIEWLRLSVPASFSPKDGKSLVNSVRSVKDDGEIALINKATAFSMAAHQAAIKAVKPGVSEQQISALMQGTFLMKGCERPSYAPIVGSGFHSTTLHYSENTGTMKSGDVVVIDVACEYSMYASDITRTLPVNGKFTDRQREIYNIVLGAQRAASEAFESGKSILRGEHSLQTIAYEYINTHGKDLHGQALGKYFIHGLGHPVGLNVHDPSDQTSPMPLAPGMVFTIEPGIYIPEENLGVRIEDIYYVDKAGKLLRMTEDLPHTAEEVEHAMATSPPSAEADPGMKGKAPGKK